MRGKIIKYGVYTASKRGNYNVMPIYFKVEKLDSTFILWANDGLANCKVVLNNLLIGQEFEGVEVLKDSKIIDGKSNFVPLMKEVKDRSQFNKCSHLEINNEYDNSKDTLGDLINMQKMLQESAYNISFDKMTLGNIKDFWLVNNHSFQDEVHEMFDALGGIKDGSGNAIWKYWKNKHKDLQDKTLSDLSENDLKELKMEYIDMLHFLLILVFA